MTALMMIDRAELAESAELDALVGQALEGDALALTRLLLAARARATPAIERKVRQSPRLAEATSAEDLLQDASFSAVRDLRRGMFKPELIGGEFESFVKWFAKIARNRVLDKIDEINAEKRGGGRKRVPWQREDGSSTSKLPDAIIVNLATPSTDLKRGELVAAVRQGLDRIRPIYRSVLEMKMVFGLSHREIAAELGKEEPTVRKLLSRAIVALSKEVGDYSKYITRV